MEVPFTDRELAVSIADWLTTPWDQLMQEHQEQMDDLRYQAEMNNPNFPITPTQKLWVRWYDYLLRRLA